MTHDQLQSMCHIWLWNKHPELRHLFHSNFNDIKLFEKIVGGMMRVKLGGRVRAAALSTMKTLGMVKGTLDWQFYHNGVLHVIDFKVGKDRLSKEQHDTIRAIEQQGGKAYEVRSFEQFKNMIEKIIGS